jgi:hypothetical protein
MNLAIVKKQDFLSFDPINKDYDKKIFISFIFLNLFKLLIFLF